MSTPSADQINKLSGELAERAAFLNYLIAKNEAVVDAPALLARVQRIQATLDLIELTLGGMQGAPVACATGDAVAPNDA